MATGFQSVDIDDDGEPEIIYTFIQEGVEGGRSTSQKVFTFKEGEVRPMSLPFMGFLKDVDGDGRLDLWLIHDEEDRMDCPGYAWERVTAPSFWARGLPGGIFSVTDPVAVEHARKICPTRPIRIVQKKGNWIDDEATAKNALCARAWGRSVLEITTELRKGCKDFEPRQECEEVAQKRPRECRHLAVILSWVERLPVFSLPP
ncbi:MAG: hypothetical protein RMJ98_22485 [Myxococcales bacterium]|nr:hypothetical protein [Myxococcales bacterium]